MKQKRAKAYKKKPDEVELCLVGIRVDLFITKFWDHAGAD